MIDYEIARNVVSVLTGGRELPPSRAKIAATILWHAHTNSIISGNWDCEPCRVTVEHLMELCAYYLTDTTASDMEAEGRAMAVLRAISMITESANLPLVDFPMVHNMIREGEIK